MRRTSIHLAVLLAGVFAISTARAETAPVAEAPAPSTQPAREPVPTVLGKNTVVTEDVQYANDGPESAEFQRLDIYAPENAKDRPVVIFVHGGGWTRGDKAEVGSQPKLFNDAGMILVSVDYRLSPAFSHPTNVQDVAAAIKWTHDHIADYGGDPKRLFVMGHSAGSHLASLVALDGKYLARHGMKPADLAGAIMLDGSAYDIPDRIVKGAAKLAENCRRTFGDDPAKQADASPVNHIKHNDGAAPFLFIYVNPDSLNCEQSRTMNDKLTLTGHASGMLHVEGKTHHTLVADMGTDDNDQAGPAIVKFVSEAPTR